MSSFICVCYKGCEKMLKHIEINTKGAQSLQQDIKENLAYIKTKRHNICTEYHRNKTNKQWRQLHVSHPRTFKRGAVICAAR